MTKKDINKILTTGSLKQKLILVAEEKARNTYYQEPLLTKDQYKDLINSFIKNNDIKLFDKYNNHSIKVCGAISNLQGLMLEVMVNYSNLRGYILMWNAIENAELLANSILHEIKDEKERKRVAQSGANIVDLFFTKAIIDQESYIDLKVDFIDENEYNLFYVINNVKRDCTDLTIKFLSWRQSIIDYMKENNFNIITYKNMIQKFTDIVYTPIIGLDKYSGEINIKTKHFQVEKILKKYDITPKIEDLEVDKNIYDLFKKDYLGNE